MEEYLTIEQCLNFVRTANHYLENWSIGSRGNDITSVESIWAFSPEDNLRLEMFLVEGEVWYRACDKKMGIDGAMESSMQGAFDRLFELLQAREDELRERKSGLHFFRNKLWGY